MSADRIFGAAARYLGKPEAVLSSEEVKQFALSRQRQPIHPLDASVSALDLPLPTVRYLWSLGVFRIRDLLKLRTNNYSNILGLEARDKREIDEELDSYLVELDSTLEPFVITSLLKNDLRLVLDGLGINERAWLVLELRAMRLLTLREIGDEIGGVSRQLVSELIRQVDEKVRRTLNSLVVFLDHFEERSKIAGQRIGDDKPELDTLIPGLLPDPVGSNLLADEKEVKRMIVLIRTLALHREPWFSKDLEQRWNAFISLSCSVEPMIEKTRWVSA